MEQLIRSIWQQALDVETLHLDDNFFDLGGHSVLMIRVQSKLEEALGHPIPIVDLFDYPTIHSLARHLLEQLARDEPRREHASIHDSINRAQMRKSLMQERRKKPKA
jgi:acyl carrier protein